MSKKRRIYQVAREFGISIEALKTFLEKHKFSVATQMSPVTDEMYEIISNEFGGEVKVVAGDNDIKKTLKERQLNKEEQKQKEIEEYEERMRLSQQVLSETLKRRKASKKSKKQKDEVVEKLEAVTEQEQPSKTDAEVAPKTDKLKEEKEPVAQRAKKAIEVADISAEGKKSEGKVSKAKKAAKDKPEESKKIAAEEGKPVEAKKELTAKEIEEEQKKKKKLKRKERIKEIKQAADSTESDEKKKRVRKKKKRGERLSDVKTQDKSKKKLKKKKKRFVISDEEVEESIKQTLAAMEDTSKTRKRRKKVKETAAEEEDENVLRINEFITVGELADELGVESNEVIKKCLQLGLLVTINQRLDKETLEIVADEYGYKVEIMPEFGAEVLEEVEEEEEDESKLQPRWPVVTIMGHVDHGKTSLLDYIRSSNIIQKEAGGITQHIGAYRVKVDSKRITFLDTPGHEAFTAMRARGAQATDIVVLVVAADDSVMPQTIEAIDHAKAANVPIVVAINKIDKPNANPEKIKKQLSERGVLIEEWGGKHQCIEISAKTGQNVDKLLESILIEAEMLELKANPDRLASGVVIESRLDKGKGVVATVLIQKGTLRVGDPFIVGQFHGKVRSMFDERGKKMKEANPSMPVLVTGFTGLPQAGDQFLVLKSERDAREISLRRQQLKREQDYRRVHHITLDEISRQIKTGGIKELALIIKGDVDGSVEAINDSLLKLSNEEVTVKIILKGVGAISESDVLLASASNAIILGFQVRPTVKAREIAKKENVDIRLYRVIYDAIADVR
ncbi:translation initiation factor IF-2, partial [candidate division KSB1 bacterium 4484_87]